MKLPGEVVVGLERAVGPGVSPGNMEVSGRL